MNTQKNYEYVIKCHVNTDIDGVNQICESTDQKNSLQCVNHNLHVAQSYHEYACETPESEQSMLRSHFISTGIQTILSFCSTNYRIVHIYH